MYISARSNGWSSLVEKPPSLHMLISMFSLVDAGKSRTNHGGLLKVQHAVAPAQPCPSHTGSLKKYVEAEGLLFVPVLPESQK